MILAMRNLLVLAAVTLASALPTQGKVNADVKKAKAKRSVGGAVVFVQDDFPGPIKACTVSPDGAVAVVCTEDGLVHFNRLDTRLGGDDAKIGEGDNSFLYKIEDAFLSAKGDRLIGRIDDSTVAIVNKEPKVLQILRGMPGLLVTALHPDGVQFAGGMRGGLVRTWDTSNGKPLAYLSMLFNKEITWLGFSPDGKSILAATADKKLWTFTYPGAAKKYEVDVPAALTHVSFTGDGNTMVSHAGEQVLVFEVVTLKLKSSFETGKPVVRSTISADGRTLAVAHEDGTAALLDAATGKRSCAWEAHPGQRILCLEFVRSKAGKQLLVTAAQKGDLVCWSEARLRGHDDGKSGKKGKSGRKGAKGKRSKGSSGKK